MLHLLAETPVSQIAEQSFTWVEHCAAASETWGFLHHTYAVAVGALGFAAKHVHSAVKVRKYRKLRTIVKQLHAHRAQVRAEA